jgi:hypothetical protein
MVSEEIFLSEIAATGGLSYYISARVIERNTFQLSQDNLNTSTRVLDEKAKQSPNVEGFRSR